MTEKDLVTLLYVDLFCGAGGTSTGVETALIDGCHCARVVACVNHDAHAIASHAANHPGAMHFTEDIRTLELSPLVSHLSRCRAEYPNARTVLWASLECTNFSRAKGGKPRDADSRTLAEHLFRYIETIDPDYIQIENVEEFMSWGSLDATGRPLSKDRGRSYVRWVNRITKYGYRFDHRILNAADYGAYTSRKRFFGIFAKHGLPIVFPEPTHGRQYTENLFGVVPKWRAVRDCLDFDDEGQSIFTRKKPLSEGTLKRIYAGLIKFVAGGKDSFMARYHNFGPQKGFPGSCITHRHQPALASFAFLSKQYSGAPADKNISVDGPAGTITTVDHHAFVSVHYGNGFNTSVDAPAATITTKDRMALVQMTFLDMQYGNGTPSSVDTVAGTVTTNPKHHLVTVRPYAAGNIQCHYLMNPQFDSARGSVDSPCFTLIAGMDKRPPYIVTAECGSMSIMIYDTDSPMTALIKEFMTLYNIIDIKMRMLKVLELKRIQGFPDDYVLIGTQAEQKKFIGNAVEVTVARSWCVALCRAVREHDLQFTAPQPCAC